LTCNTPLEWSKGRFSTNFWQDFSKGPAHIFKRISTAEIEPNALPCKTLSTSFHSLHDISSEKENLNSMVICRKLGAPKVESRDIKLDADDEQNMEVRYNVFKVWMHPRLGKSTRVSVQSGDEVKRTQGMDFKMFERRL
jgi:hypothetical protein